MTKSILVKDKINLHETILPSSVLTTEEMHQQLNRWTELLHQHRIHVVFHQDPMNIREQYDYLANDFLFMELPPHPNEMQFCFVYERVEENTLSSDVDPVIEKVLEDILKSRPLKHPNYLDRLIHFNEYENLSEPEFTYLINNTPPNDKEICQCSIFFDHKKITDNALVASGKFQLGYVHQQHCEIRQGGWSIRLKKSCGNWLVKAVFIDGC